MSTDITSPAFWDNAYKNNVDFTAISTASLSRMLSYRKPTDDTPSCLDIGCGTGQLTRELYHRGYRVHGIDLSVTAIEQAKSATTAPTDYLQYEVANFEDLTGEDLPTAPYDLIICKLVYAFMNDKPAFLQKVHNLLTATGFFVIITPLIPDVAEHKKHIAVSYDDTTSLLKAEFTHVESFEEKSLTYFIAH